MSVAAAKAAQGFLPTGDTGNTVKSIIVISVLILIIVVFVIMFKKGIGIFSGITDAVGGFFETIGIKDSAEDIAADNAVKAIDEKANQTVSPFNPTFYKTAPTQATLEKLADQIYDSVGHVWDDPEDAFGAFKQATNWAMISQIADKFNQLYNSDVYAWMKIHFDRTSQKDILAKIVNYAFSLPKY
jgi:hypothetical protein